MITLDSHPDVVALCAEEPALANATRSVPLMSVTAPTWVRVALSDVDALLDDHAQCELKAASNALAMLGRHPEHDDLVRRMTALSKEEMVHYRMVRRVLIERGGTPTRPAPNPYVKGLGRDRLGGPYALLDDLLVCALIEARSCERFLQLSRGLQSRSHAEVHDAHQLAAFYARLAKSESGHAHLFVELAERIFGAEKTAAELERRSHIEAETLDRLPATPRMHGGHLAD